MSGLARYRVLRPIREGGAFDVLEAVVLGAGDFERRVALKRVRKEDEGVDDANEAILTEARLAGRLRHANIVATIDAGLDDEGLAYLVMDYVDGLDAAALWKRGQAAARPMPPEVAVHVVTEVANALDYVHAATDRDGRALSIVHRDVTPSNVMISWSGDVLLTDFGIARGILRAQRTAAGLSKGTLDFMAPEQVTGGHIDLRADVFGLGALLHCLLTGRSPTQGLDMAARARGQRVLDSSVPPALQRIVLRATSPQRAERYMSAGELAQDVWRAGLAAPPGGGRAALHAWLSSLRAPPGAPSPPAVASLFALDVGSASGVLGAAPLHLGTAVHAHQPRDQSSLISFAEEGDVSTAEAGLASGHHTDIDLWLDPTVRRGAVDDTTDASMTIRGGPTRLLLLDGEAAAGTSLDLLLPARLAESSPLGVERTRIERTPRGSVPTPPPQVPSDEELVRRVSEPPAGVSVDWGSTLHGAADAGADFGPAPTDTAALPARGGSRPVYLAGLASGVVLVLVVWLAARIVLVPPEPLVPAGVAPELPGRSAPALGVAAPRPTALGESPHATPTAARDQVPPPSPAPVLAESPSPAPSQSPRGQASASPRPSARPSRSPAVLAPTTAPPPPPPASEAPVSTAARLDALGRRLKALATSGSAADEVQALESEYFRLRRAAPRTPEEERVHTRAVEALWSRVERTTL
jgi:serine/threonine protein kinase